ncbi:MAG: hypothetical protein JNJ73_09295 [Hyphomonadaceae bacterium]|nr:hypothetical protein [Hyphomonadaceae bacterium]
MKRAAILACLFLAIAGTAHGAPLASAAETDAARRDAEAKAARYEAARELAESEDLLGGDAAPDAIRDLAVRREALRTTLKELSRLIDPDSPTMRSLLAQADQLEVLLRAELARLLARLRAEMEAAQAHVAALEQDLQSQPPPQE